MSFVLILIIKFFLAVIGMMFLIGPSFSLGEDSHMPKAAKEMIQSAIALFIGLILIMIGVYL